MPKLIVGTLAILISTALASFWGFWGAVENFHEGWYFTSIWSNLALALGQYFVPMLGFWALALLSLKWPRLGALLHIALASGVLYLFGWRRQGAWYLWPPLLVLAAAYAWAKPKPHLWLKRAVAILPILTAIGYGIFPAYLAFTRIPLANTGPAIINGLTWAPAGPGWPQRLGGSWQQANDACAALATKDQPWRLPTVDEMKTALPHHKVFSSQTTKDAPLWNKHSQIIYMWTAGNPTFVSYNGWVVKTTLKDKRGYIGWRCVMAQ
jgi:hypothetical protein